MSNINNISNIRGEASLGYVDVRGTGLEPGRAKSEESPIP